MSAVKVTTVTEVEEKKAVSKFEVSIAGMA
jgi:hypothetical protein